MKSIKEWADTLREPFSSQFIVNLKMGIDDKEMFESFDDCKNSAFIWNKTPEGYDYWLRMKWKDVKIQEIAEYEIY